MSIERLILQQRMIQWLKTFDETHELVRQKAAARPSAPRPKPPRPVPGRAPHPPKKA
jgi:hypothetical protein